MCGGGGGGGGCPRHIYPSFLQGSCPRGSCSRIVKSGPEHSNCTLHERI